MTNKVWFRTGVALLLLFLIIKLFLDVNHIFMPIIIIIQSIILPLLLSGFLFYICLPFQKCSRSVIYRDGQVLRLSYSH